MSECECECECECVCVCSNLSLALVAHVNNCNVVKISYKFLVILIKKGAIGVRK